MQKTIQRKRDILVFTLPALLLFTGVVLIPIISTFYHSMCQWDGLTTPQFNGVDNYIRLFQDPLFHTSMKNVLLYTLVLASYQILISSLFAFLLSLKWVRGRRFMRTTLFFPVVLSVTVVCQLWSSVFNGQHGLLNKLLETMGSSYQQAWLSNSATAIFIVAFVDSWQYMGYYLLIIYTAMQSVSKSLYEAADIDGATPMRQFRSITLPLLRDTYSLCLTLTITGGLKAFQNMYIMIGGGPGTATYTLTYLMYRSAFRINQFGYGCASATILILMCLAVTILVNKLLPSRDYY
jgi:raffinose/stachyose/melibiose transport system permease protein